MHNEVKKLEEQTLKASVPSGILNLGQTDVCEICHKTKFADGTGNKCHYCSKKSCARCGGNTSPKSGKVSKWDMRVVRGVCLIVALCVLVLVGGWLAELGR